MLPKCNPEDEWLATMDEHVDGVAFDSDVNFITLFLETSWLTLFNICISFDGPRHINISFSGNRDPIEGVHSCFNKRHTLLLGVIVPLRGKVKTSP